MKKILALITAVLMLLVTLSACSNGVEVDATGDASGSAGLPAGNSGLAGIVNGALTPSESESESTGGEDGGIVDNTTFTKKDDTTIEFGSYPQTEVTDATLIESLTTKAGELPSSSDKKNWTAIENMTDTWYIDVEENGKKYRGIYFTSYREVDGNTFQYDNGYETEKAYWFEYAPISWTILKEESGKALILCDIAIDCQPYASSGGNSYADSEIRSWLNEEFYNTAFNKLQQALIAETDVDNSASSTGTDNNQYASDNTKDKIFLLSRPEAKEITFAVKQPTDYTEAMGVYQNGSCWWWTRSPYYKDYTWAHVIKTDGSVHSYDVTYASGGVVPALWINLGESTQEEPAQ